MQTMKKNLARASLYARLCLVLLLVFTINVQAASQHTVTIRVQNETLREVLKQFKNQTGIYFMYNASDIDVNTRMDLE